MSLRDFFYRRSEPRWLNQESPPPVYRSNSPYGGYGGNSPRGGYGGGGGGDSPTTEMRVVMCCNKCEEKVREEVGEVYGVQDVLTDQARSEVVVIGFADAHDVLKKAKKVDKRADITASDSFTTHHGHSHKHNRIHHKHSHRRSDHGYGSGSYPIETTSSPRYNASYHQSSYGSPSRYIDHGGPGSDGYRHRQYRPTEDGYRSDYQPQYRPTPMYDPEYRAEYDEYRPRYHQGYRPSQDYLPRYVEERDYSYPEPLMNPDYIHHLDYY